MRRAGRGSILGNLGLEFEQLEDRRLLALSAELILDLSPSGISSSPHSFTEWNGLVYFQRPDGFRTQLSTYDGAAIQDLAPDEIPLGSVREFYATSNGLYLVGSPYEEVEDPDSLTLWRYDGQQFEQIEVCTGETCGPVFAPSNLTEFDGANLSVGSREQWGCSRPRERIDKAGRWHGGRGRSCAGNGSRRDPWHGHELYGQADRRQRHVA